VWSSKDICCIILMAVLGFVSTALVVQMAGLISGIPGSNYVFTIFLAVQTTISFLVFEGRRWRFFVQFSIFTLLIIPTHLGGLPFAVQSRIHFVITALVADLIINSFYETSRKNGKLKLWSVSGSLLFWVMLPFFSLLIRPLFFSIEAVLLFANVVLLLLPVIVIESVAGGYVGYRIFLRLRKEGLLKASTEYNHGNLLNARGKKKERGKRRGRCRHFNNISPEV
jgi:hypothetical protein